MHLLELPADILRLIFLSFPATINILQLRLICKHFDKVMNDEYWVAIALQRLTCDVDRCKAMPMMCIRRDIRTVSALLKSTSSLFNFKWIVENEYDRAAILVIIGGSKYHGFYGQSSNDKISRIFFERVIEGLPEAQLIKLLPSIAESYSETNVSDLRKVISLIRSKEPYPGDALYTSAFYACIDGRYEVLRECIPFLDDKHRDAILSYSISFEVVDTVKIIQDYEGSLPT